MRDEASYVCDSCGEEIVVPIDLSAGTEQEYVGLPGLLLSEPHPCRND
jgi:hypothetical protein